MAKFFKNNIKYEFNDKAKRNLRKESIFLNKINKTNLNYIVYKNISFIINLFFILLIPISFARELSSKNEIILKIKGDGFAQFLRTNLEDKDKPCEIEVNNEIIDSSNVGYTFTEPENTVIIRWNSPVSTCENFFFGFDKILEIDLSNFDSSQATSMVGMFFGCSSLTSINLKNFNTSSSKNMDSMFYKCSSLTSLDLSDFDTSSVSTMGYMFYMCTSLVHLDISSFNTELVTNINSMFSGDESLISLDLSSFNISSLSDINSAFINCKSLVFLNLNSFVENNIYGINEILSGDVGNLVYCIDAYKAPKIYNFLNGINQNNDCNNTCFTETRKIIVEKKICIDDCSKDDTYIYEYNNICYSSKQSDKADNGQTDYVENTEKDVNTENTEKPERTETNINTENNKLDTEIINKPDDSKFSSENFFKEKELKDNNEKITKKDEIIKAIKEDLILGNLDTLLEDLISGDKKDLLVRDNKTIYQITTSENQKNNEYTNVSTINLGLCEDRLKTLYGIDGNLSLIIFKVDYYKPGLLIPIIGYEVYHPENKSKLDLNKCNDILAKINIPVSIDEVNEFKYNPNSEYYKDECFTYTTGSGTDILVSDRKNEYEDNNLSLCENICTYNGYDKDQKKAKCECELKIEIGSISDILYNDNILLSNFSSDSLSSNLFAMKCSKTLFTKDGLILNIGNYLILFTFIYFTIASIIFYKCGYHIIESDIKEIISSRKRKSKIRKTRTKINQIDIYSKDNIMKRPHRKSNSQKIIKNSLIISNPLKKSLQKKNRFQGNEKIKGMHNSISSSKVELKNTNTFINIGKSVRKKKQRSAKNIKRRESILLKKYKNFELNLFNFEMAFKYDKRTFCQYYLSLFLYNNIIFFAFYPNKDNNLKIIKIAIFFLSFDIYFLINTLFFNNSVIHQIYKDEGTYNLSYFMPKIILSFFIGYYIVVIIKFFSLSQRNLFEIKNDDNNISISKKSDKIKKCLIIKYILFFVLSFTFLSLFWYYLSAFCAVFKNSQIYVIKNTFLSFVLSLSYPLLFNIFTCIIRLNSLRYNQSFNVCTYRLSQFMQLL